MISKLTLQSVISKYYLGLNESVKWVTKDNSLEIDFMTPTRDVIGSVICNNFDFVTLSGSCFNLACSSAKPCISTKDLLTFTTF